MARIVTVLLLLLLYYTVVHRFVFEENLTRRALLSTTERTLRLCYCPLLH